MYKMVWIDNMKVMMEKHIFNIDFFNFIKDFMNLIDIPIINYRKNS